MESHNAIYQCQDKAYRLKWDEPLKGEIENIAVNEQDKRECRNAGALLELLQVLDLPELYEVVDLGDARTFSQMEESKSENQNFKIYPNPGSDFINIQTSNINANLKVSIFDLSGKAIFTAQNTSSDYMLIDVSGFAKGMYMIQVGSVHEILGVQKLVIE